MIAPSYFTLSPGDEVAISGWLPSAGRASVTRCQPIPSWCARPRSAFNPAPPAMPTAGEVEGAIAQQHAEDDANDPEVGALPCGPGLRLLPPRPAPSADPASPLRLRVGALTC